MTAPHRRAMEGRGAGRTGGDQGRAAHSGAASHGSPSWTPVRSFLLALLLAVPGCGGEDASPDAPADRGTPVAVWVVEERDATEERRWAGSLEPLRVHPVHASVEARVVAVEVRDGQEVGAGTLLLRMEGLDEEARREVLLQRQERLEGELARWQELAAAGAAGPGEVVAAELRLFEAREALAGLDAVRAALALRAGVAGRVVGLATAPGMQASPGQPLLAVEETASYGVRLRVPPTETRWFEDPGDLVIEANSGARFTVERVALGPDPQPGYVQVDLYPGASLEEGTGASGSLHRQGVSVRYRASVTSRVVPWTAVATDGGRAWVAVAVPGEPDEPGGEPPYRVERRDVELGSAREEGVEVTRGVSEGDRVLRFEPRSHPEGQRVDPRSSASDREGR